MAKLIIFSAPSGSGKSTIINYLLTQNLNLAFSISATSRPPRGTEKDGVEYFFLTPDEFRRRIANDEFLEYEEVYQDRFYGTLKEQVEKQLAAGQNVVFDVDVVGGCNIKKFYGERALSVFIQPPSVEELRKRLVGRGTDAPEVIENRVAKAEYELGFAPKFDTVIVNDDLETAKAEALKVSLNLERMKQRGGVYNQLAPRRKNSPKLNKALLIINSVLFVCSLVVGVLYIHHGEPRSSISMFLISVVTIFNAWAAWRALQRRPL